MKKGMSEQSYERGRCVEGRTSRLVRWGILKSEAKEAGPSRKAKEFTVFT